MWWFKRKKIKWYMRWWNDAKAAVAVVASVITFFTAVISYLQINTDSFIETTKIQSVSANSRLYTKINTIKELPESSYILVYINGQQVDNRIYPEGIPRGEILIDTALPFNSVKNKVLDVEVRLVFKGFRTLFIPEVLSSIFKVKQEKSNASINHSVYRYLLV